MSFLGPSLIKFWVVVALTLWKSRLNRESKFVVHSNPANPDLESKKVRVMSGDVSIDPQALILKPLHSMVRIGFGTTVGSD